MDVRVSAAVPAEHCPTFRASLLGILVSAFFGERPASLRIHVIGLLLFGVPVILAAVASSGFHHPRKIAGYSGYRHSPKTFFIEGFGFLFLFCPPVAFWPCSRFVF